MVCGCAVVCACVCAHEEDGNVTNWSSFREAKISEKTTKVHHTKMYIKCYGTYKSSSGKS